MDFCYFPFLRFVSVDRSLHTSAIAAKFSPLLLRFGMATQTYTRQTRTSPNAMQQQLNHKRQMQQFYLHKLFDLLLDAEFLPLIPSDPVVAAIQMQEKYSMNNSVNNMAARYQPQAQSPGMQRQETVFYNASQKARRHSGQFLHQHLFGGKRPDYSQYRAS